jgi:hypothetical protein
VNNFISQEVLHGQALRTPDLRSASLRLSPEQGASKETSSRPSLRFPPLPALSEKRFGYPHRSVPADHFCRLECLCFIQHDLCRLIFMNRFLPSQLISSKLSAGKIMKGG